MLFQLGGLVIPTPSIPLSPALLMLPFTLSTYPYTDKNYQKKFAGKCTWELL